MRGGAEVMLRVQGENKKFRATAIENDPDRVREALVHYLRKYPQDAAYHDIRLNKDRTLVTNRGSGIFTCANPTAAVFRCLERLCRGG